MITAILFGSLIKHQLVSSLTFGMALRVVLDALCKPLDSKMFSFGLTALKQFRYAHGELVEFIESALVRISSSQHKVEGILPLQIKTRITCLFLL